MGENGKRDGLGERISNVVHNIASLFHKPEEFLAQGLISPVVVAQDGLKQASGNEALLGETAIVEDINVNEDETKVWVRIEGERWKMICEQELSIDDEVTITGVKGLSLIGEKTGE